MYTDVGSERLHKEILLAPDRFADKDVTSSSEFILRASSGQCYELGSRTPAVSIVQTRSRGAWRWLLVNEQSNKQQEEQE